MQNEEQKMKNGFGKFWEELQSLDAENYGDWSLPVKIFSWIMIAVLMVLIGYFLAVKPIKDEIYSATLNRELILQEFEKQDMALKNATQYELQLNQIEKRFQEQLMQLPKETEISGLVEDINQSGRSSNLKITDITLTAEQKKEVFIEQPISIVATGDFHTFGRFVEMVAALPRIVTIQGFKVQVDQSKQTEVPVINYGIEASTYRYLDPRTEAPAPAPAPAL